MASCSFSFNLLTFVFFTEVVKTQKTLFVGFFVVPLFSFNNSRERKKRTITSVTSGHLIRKQGNVAHGCRVQFPRLYTPGMQSSFFNFKLFSVSAVHGFCTSMVLFMLPLGKFWTWVLTGIRIRLDPELFPGSGMKHSGFTTLDASDHPTRFFNQCF